MNIDIVIATYNAEKRIVGTLESFCKMAVALDIPECVWRIIFINNNSTDKTHEILESYKDRLPIEILECTSPGKSKALNSAIPYLTGDLIILSDDDVEVAPDWLVKVHGCAIDNPDYSIFAGRIKGVWEQELDPDLKSWIPVGSTYALHDEDMVSGPCDPGKVWGPNMAVRREIFDAGFKFDERIGPAPKKLYAMGQETEFVKRAAAQGYKCFFNSDAVVKHLIKKETLTEEWIICRAERLGYGIFAVGRQNYDRKMPDFVPVIFEVLFYFCFWACFYPLSYLMKRSKHRFWSRWKFYYYRGLLKGYQEFL